MRQNGAIVVLQHIFAAAFAHCGEFLADARAIEAAGVDSVWLDDSADGFDPLLVLAQDGFVCALLTLGVVAVGLWQLNRHLALAFPLPDLAGLVLSPAGVARVEGLVDRLDHLPRLADLVEALRGDRGA